MADAMADSGIERLTSVNWQPQDRWGDTPLQVDRKIDGGGGRGVRLVFHATDVHMLLCACVCVEHHCATNVCVNTLLTARVPCNAMCNCCRRRLSALVTARPLLSCRTRLTASSSSNSSSRCSSSSLRRCWFADSLCLGGSLAG